MSKYNYPFKIIRKVLKKIPYHMISKVRYFYSSKFKYRNQLKIIDYSSKREHAKINEAIKQKIPIYFIYDRDTSPPTYGDFFYFVMIYRFFQLKTFDITFIIIESKQSTEWIKSDPFIRKLKEDQNNIIDKLSIQKNKNIKIVNYKEAIRIIKREKSFSLFHSQIENRDSIHPFLFNFLNYLSVSENNSLFFTKKELLTLNKIQNESYVAFQFRHNKEYGLDRNLTEKEFLKIIKELKSSFSDKDIMIISDKSGCEIAKKWSKNNNLNLLFSKDYSEDFLSDISLLAGSEFYFQYKGGGMGLIASSISDLHQVQSWVFYGRKETPFKKNKVFHWLKNHQIVLSNKSLNFTLSKMRYFKK